MKGQNIEVEAVADLAGVKAMMGLLEQKGSVDYDLYFRTYAAVWRSVNTREYELARLIGNPHPLSYLRVNAVLQQFRQFMDTYGITEGDGMYLAPEDRVTVW